MRSVTPPEILSKRIEAEGIFATLEQSAMFCPDTSNLLQKPSKDSVIGAIVVVGAGGTGSWLMPKLVKTVNDLKRKDLLSPDFSITVIDADEVESKNLIRQNFVMSDIGKNKAEVMSTRYAPHLNNNIPILYVDKYIASKDQIASKKPEEVDFFIDVDTVIPPYEGVIFAPADLIVFNLVDNNKARQALHDSIKADTKGYSSAYVIDVGNEMYHGQYFVSSYSKSQVSDASLSNVLKSVKDFRDSNNFYDFSPSTVDAEDDVSLYSCAEADVDEANQDQMLVANDFAATMCHNWLIEFAMNILSTESALISNHASFVCGKNLGINKDRSSYILSYEDSFNYLIAAYLHSEENEYLLNSVPPFARQTVYGMRSKSNIYNCSIDDLNVIKFAVNEVFKDFNINTRFADCRINSNTLQGMLDEGNRDSIFATISAIIINSGRQITRKNFLSILTILIELKSMNKE